jgi:hypothetical protein
VSFTIVAGYFWFGSQASHPGSILLPTHLGRGLAPQPKHSTLGARECLKPAFLRRRVDSRAARADLSPGKIHREVLRHCHMSIEAELAVPTPRSLFLSESYQGPAKALPVASGVNCNVIKQKVIVFWQEHDKTSYRSVAFNNPSRVIADVGGVVV